MGSLGGQGVSICAPLRRLAALAYSYGPHNSPLPPRLQMCSVIHDSQTCNHAPRSSQYTAPCPRTPPSPPPYRRGLQCDVIATMLGHLLRCLYYREQRCHSGGWCKASWIAEVFGIHLRTVKAARKHLVEIGWLRTFHASHRVGNHWGTYTLISLSWTRTAREDHAEPTPDCPPPNHHPPPSSAQPDCHPFFKEDIEPFQESQHQQPALAADPTGSASPLPPLPPRTKTGVEIQHPRTTGAHLLSHPAAYYPRRSPRYSPALDPLRRKHTNVG